MITIQLQNGNRYEIFDSGMRLGHINLYRNPYHAKNCYLDLNLFKYDSSIAKELFALLRKELQRPLQVMLYSCDLNKCNFLTSGDFQRMRRCYEIEVSTKDLIFPLKPSVSIVDAERGNSYYLDCCNLLYDSYSKCHEAISPLTANRESFFSDLPNDVKFYQESGMILHYAFIENNEIAYIGTINQSSFRDFAQTLLSQMFERYNSVLFECDDCDSVAMELKDMFRIPNIDTYDTYILN